MASAQPIRRTAAPVIGDAVRFAAAVSVVAGVFAYGGLGGALFFFVLGGTMIPRALGAPAALDLSYCLAILVAAWAAQLDWYVAVSWLDLVVHTAVTGLVATVVHLALVRLNAVAPVNDPRLRRARLGSALVTTALGVALATLWELGEWFGHTQIDESIQVGYHDTLGDLAAGTVGSVVAGILLARGLLLAGARR
ncbi:hypothetical protein KV100_00730 [Mumia sp. zg.B21]|uniref:hypothetical protein n=1 Tax=Mumia sp. zg.B21 TaxID=2855447 RepID=UPI001C6E2DC1|nr:hypothetical protein [Mumia sp. zg.B21]MBW9208163.1 hypothetical protein [Mumia sp. zg.B21]